MQDLAWTNGHRRETLQTSYQLSAISYQLSAISYQLSAISYQLLAVLILFARSVILRRNDEGSASRERRLGADPSQAQDDSKRSTDA